MRRDISITCPCCKAILIVDRDTGQLLGQRTKEEQKMEAGDVFEKRLDDVRQRAASGTQAFDDAHQEALNKRKHLDDAFEEARKKAKDKGKDDPGPGKFW